MTTLFLCFRNLAQAAGGPRCLAELPALSLHLITCRTAAFNHGRSHFLQIAVLLPLTVSMKDVLKRGHVLPTSPLSKMVSGRRDNSNAIFRASTSVFWYNHIFLCSDRALGLARAKWQVTEQWPDEPSSGPTDTSS